MVIEKKKSVFSKFIWSVICLILAVFTVFAVMRQRASLSFSDLRDFIVTSNKPWLIAGIVSSILYVWFEASALMTILKEVGYPTRRSGGLLFSAADVYFSAITPSATGGQPASALFMMREGIPTGTATATLVLNLIMYNAAIGVLGIIAVLVAPVVLWQFSMPADILIAVGVIVLGALLFMFLLLLRKGDSVFDFLLRCTASLKKRRFFKGTKLFRKISRAKEEYSQCADLVSGRTELLFKAFGWNFLQRLSQILVPVFIYLSGGGSLKIARLLFSKQCLINIGYNFVPIPGAIGVSDYLMLDGFTTIMNPDMAFQVELISRAITFYLCVLLCGLITLTGYILRRERNDRDL